MVVTPAVAYGSQAVLQRMWSGGDRHRLDELGAQGCVGGIAIAGEHGVLAAWADSP